MSGVTELLDQWKQFFESVDNDIDKLSVTLSDLNTLEQEIKLATRFTKDIHGKLKKLRSLWKK